MGKYELVGVHISIQDLKELNTKALRKVHYHKFMLKSWLLIHLPFAPFSVYSSSESQRPTWQVRLYQLLDQYIR